METTQSDLRAALDRLWLVAQQPYEQKEYPEGLPGFWDPLMVLADLYADLGEAQKEQALRWCIANGRRPYQQRSIYTPEHLRFMWCNMKMKKYPSDLGPTLGNKLPKSADLGQNCYFYFSSMREAYEQLFSVWVPFMVEELW